MKKIISNANDERPEYLSPMFYFVQLCSERHFADSEEGETEEYDTEEHTAD